MWKFRFCLISMLTLCVVAPKFALATWLNEKVSFKEIEINLVYPEPYNPTYSQLSIKAFKKIEAKTKIPFKESFYVMFNDSAAFHNGLATVIPRNFIYVHLVEPESNSSISVSENYLFDTLTHEFAHMHYLQQKSGVFKLGSYFLGNISSPLSTWPRWLHEGWATALEERFSDKKNAAYLKTLQRAYAEHVSQNPQSKLSSADLNATHDLHSVSSGEIPYAFGENLVQKILAKIEHKSWIESSKSSLGISFRKNTKELELDIDQLFEETEAEWASAKLGEQSSHSKVLYSADSIVDINYPLVVAIKNGESVIYNIENKTETLWPASFYLLKSAIPAKNNNIWVAYYKRQRAKDGAMLVVEQHTLKGGKVSKLCSAFRSFEESFISFDTNGDEVLVNLSPRNPALSEKHSIKLNNDCHTEKRPFKLKRKAFADPKTRNIVVLSQQKAHDLFTKPKTGAIAADINYDNVVWAEKGWKKDTIYSLHLKHFEKGPKYKPANSSPVFQENKNYTTTKNIKHVKKYRPVHSIWPHYWLPRVFVSQDSTVFAGSVWYHDVSKSVEGVSDVGYDTFTRAPFFQTQLTYYPFIIYGSYYQDRSLGFSNELIKVGAGLQGLIYSGENYSASGYLSYRNTRSNRENSSTTAHGIDSTLSLTYAADPNISNIATNLSTNSNGFKLSQSLNWISNIETYTNLEASFHFGLRHSLQLQHAYTDIKNYPVSYFLWGGMAPVGLFRPRFLSRGFPPARGLASHLARVSLNSSWKLVSRLGGLGWSRLNIQSVTQDVFVETLSPNDLLVSSSTKIGDKFFTSVGTEINFWVESLYYLDSRLFLGIYQGSKPLGETRFSLGFASSIDI